MSRCMSARNAPRCVSAHALMVHRKPSKEAAADRPRRHAYDRRCRRVHLLTLTRNMRGRADKEPRQKAVQGRVRQSSGSGVAESSRLLVAHPDVQRQHGVQHSVLAGARGREGCTSNDRINRTSRIRHRACTRRGRCNDRLVSVVAGARQRDHTAARRGHNAGGGVAAGNARHHAVRGPCGPPAKHRGNARTQLSNISQYYFMESIQKRYRSTALLFLVFCSCVRFLRIRP